MMKAKMNGAAGTEADVRSARTTIVLPIALDENLEVYALKTGTPKGEAIKAAISKFLIAQGLQPDKRPKSVQVTY